MKIGNDRRVPLMEVYALYRGAVGPEAVLKGSAVGDPGERERNQRLFYAHLYLGIYHDLLGEKKKAIEHLSQAAGKYRIGHYMGEVVRVHHDLLTRRRAR